MTKFYHIENLDRSYYKTAKATSGWRAATAAIDNRDNKYYAGNPDVTNNPWIEIELTEPVVMSGLALVHYGGCEKFWNNVQIRVSNESTSLQPDDWTDDPETLGDLALIMNKV